MNILKGGERMGTFVFMLFFIPLLGVAGFAADYLLEKDESHTL